MLAFSDLRRRVLYLLEAPTGEGYDDELIIDAISSALDAILPWIPNAKSTVLTGDGTATSFALPSDFYDVEAIKINSSGLLIPKAVFYPGGYHGSNISADNDWMLLPSGYITFSKVLASGVIYDLFYLATWAKPSISSPVQNLDVPEIAATGLAIYAASYALLPTSVSTAEIRQYGTRVDSGHPEHNPVQKSVAFLRTLFLQEMNALPKRARGTQ